MQSWTNRESWRERERERERHVRGRVIRNVSCAAYLNFMKGLSDLSDRTAMVILIFVKKNSVLVAEGVS